MQIFIYNKGEYNKMLIDRITGFSRYEYEEHRLDCSCDNCNHPYACPKNGDNECDDCKMCLEQIHYHKHRGKIDYDCPNMINYYVCCYTFKYASEILYLANKSDLMKELNEYNILSFGCGACPDLMAFEKYSEYDNKPIRYTGIDTNNLWYNIHNEISEYCFGTNIESHYIYEDALDIVSGRSFQNKNIIILQYFISHLYNTGQINKIYDFFDDLINNVISNNTNNEPVVIMLNDVNSIYCGRDYFIDLYDKLYEKGFNCTYKKFYFNYEGLNEYQQYGEMYLNNRILFNVPNDFDKFQVWKHCGSAQLLIEIERG